MPLKTNILTFTKQGQRELKYADVNLCNLKEVMHLKCVTCILKG